MSHQSEWIAKDIEKYLKKQGQKEVLRFLTCGSVDDGKSTLIGRLLHDSQMIYDDQLSAAESNSKRHGTQGDKLDLALLVDGLQAEREQGITIDVAYRYFSTEKRKYIIADTPGHTQYTRNMATGASNCDLAIILVDAQQGIQSQTKRHTYIAGLLGIRHIIVAINKMDLVDYSVDRFQFIRNAYLDFSESLPLEDIRFIPLSALEGDNVVSPSQQMPWYQGQTLLEVLESIDFNSHSGISSEFRLPVQYINRPDRHFRGYAGTVASGSVSVGDTIQVLPSGVTSRVKAIETYDGSLTAAVAGQAINLVTDDELDISRGDMLIQTGQDVTIGNSLEANIVWMADAPLLKEKEYLFKFTTNQVTGRFTQLNYKIDIDTFAQTNADKLALNEIGACNLKLNQELVTDSYQNNKATGAFIVIDRLTNMTIGAGMVVKPIDQGIDKGWVSAKERRARLGHKPAIIRVDTIEQARMLERQLFDNGVFPFVINTSQLDWEYRASVLLEAGIVVLLVDLSGRNTERSFKAALYLDGNKMDIKQVIERL